MNIFEQLDKLVKKAELVNESRKYEDLPIDPSMETEEQGREYIRDFFRDELMKHVDGGGGGGEDSDEPRIMPIDPTPPPPPFHIKRPLKGPDGKDEDKTWKTAEVEWDDDEFLKRLEIEADELDKIEDIDPEEFGEEYDDFTEGPETRGPGGGGDPEVKPEDEDDESKSGGEGGEGFDGGSTDKDPFKKPDDDDEYEEKSGGSTGEDGEEGDGDADDEKTDGETGEGGGKSKDGDEGEDGEDGGEMGPDGTSTSSGGSKKDKKDGKSGRGGGSDDIDEEGEGGEEGEDTDGKGDGKSKKDGEGEEKDGEKGGGSGEDGEEEDGEDGKRGGDPGEDGGKSATEELEDTIKDALEKLAEANEDEKEELKELLDMLDDEGVTDEDIDKKEGEFDDMKEHGKEKLDKLKSLVGRLERVPTKEEIEKEIEGSKLSEEEIEEMKGDTVKSATMPPHPKDAELEELKKEAMKELDRKCKGKSKLAMSVLYHSLKTPKLDKSDWDIILDKVLAKKSKHSADIASKSTVKKVRLGDKNHIWRGDVRHYYKKEKKGEDKKSIYCFIDYSGSVKSEPGLIMTFLGKVLELTEKLTYTDLCCYTFGESLSVPRIISWKMIEEEGYEKVLQDTINFFDLRENYVGGAIENFSAVAYEINKIKRDDKNAVFFIFGDGVWTFYGNSDPPTRLKEICAAYVKDIIPFIFYYNEDDFRWKSLGKEISLLKDVVGVDDVIVTKADKMKE